jgi:arylsulfatase
VILAQGGRYGGYTLYVKDGRVTYEVNAFGNRSGIIVSSKPLEAGKAHIVVDFVPDESKPSKEPVPGGVIGSDLGTPVSSSYASPFPFNGKIDAVRVDIR